MGLISYEQWTGRRLEFLGDQVGDAGASFPHEFAGAVVIVGAVYLDLKLYGNSISFLVLVNSFDEFDQFFGPSQFFRKIWSVFGS
jgi:hypothetical protein